MLYDISKRNQQYVATRKVEAKYWEDLKILNSSG